jgi:DNA-binding response OmpR family regulator
MTETTRAIVIEDDPDLAMIYTLALEHAGFEVQKALDGNLARRLLQEFQPALVVLDLHLMGVSGVELLHQIRLNPALQETIVIIATADPLLADLYQDSADYVLIKPISYSQLNQLAKRFIGR